MANRFQSMYRLQLMGTGCPGAARERLWGWKECLELLVRSVTSEEGQGGSQLPSICQLWTPSPSAFYSGFLRLNPSVPRGWMPQLPPQSHSLKGEVRR